jgi:hypothetical protein
LGLKKRPDLAAKDSAAPAETIRHPEIFVRRRPLPNFMFAASDQVRLETKNTICDVWKTKAFCDVNVKCGVDGGVVTTSRLFLSGLSQFFCRVFLDHNFVIKEETVVVLPDVDSRSKSYLTFSCLCHRRHDTEP